MPQDWKCLQYCYDKQVIQIYKCMAEALVQRSDNKDTVRYT